MQSFPARNPRYDIASLVEESGQIGPHAAGSIENRIAFVESARARTQRRRTKGIIHESQPSSRYWQLLRPGYRQTVWL
jgi:hypothetical protein